MMRGKILFACCLTFCQLQAQDSLRNVALDEVVIQAYTASRTLEEVPASVAFVDTQSLQRYSNASMLPAVNTIPGVRMEERSPGSFRFSIRGSSIRSPFGVRNIKVYWNGLPFTDAGGNTYLNLLDLSSIGNIEVIKGPGGSLYGAGTGGVLLLNSRTANANTLTGEATLGSYGLQRYALQGTVNSGKTSANLNLSRQVYGGYREQSATRRNSFNGDYTVELNNANILTLSVLATQLEYETPGGLNQEQFDSNPKQARPGTATVPGAVEQKAAVYNNTIFAGINHDHDWNSKLTTTSGIYYADVDFRNSAIANYELRRERNYGARSVTKFRAARPTHELVMSGGAEYQRLSSPITIKRNNGGVPGDIITDADLSTDLFLLFLQADLQVQDTWFLTAAASLNTQRVDYEREAPSITRGRRTFEPIILPRLALLKKINWLSIYTSVSQGFSPPTIAELFPSRAIFDRDLDAERGTNLEFGLKANIVNRVKAELVWYNFRLDETIVIRRDASIPGEPEFFVNAGATRQRGLEASIEWHPISHTSGFIADLKIAASYSHNAYRFRDYVQADQDFSGKRVTGVAPNTAFVGLDAVFARKWYINFTANYVDHIPLNDQNSVFASQYLLLQSRIGWKPVLLRHNAEIFAGVDNLLNQTYSLGNDLNAFAGRYYNPAAPRNFFVVLKIHFIRTKSSH